MAVIKPFKGIRYNTALAGDINTLVSPPYDVINDEDKIYYHNLNDYNFVRLILGDEFPDDTDDNNRFTRAGNYYKDWIKNNILISDEPSIYLYQQDFTLNNKRCLVNGFIVSVKLCEYSENVILPHENTLAKPKGALDATIENTQANLDCVYGLYSDRENTLNVKVINKYLNLSPTIDAIDKDNNHHRLWCISDKKDIKAVCDFMADKQIAIADGHHRYETALKYRNKVREQNNPIHELPTDYVMMTIVNVYEKDLLVLPTHRIINNVDPLLVNTLVLNLEDNFDVIPSKQSTLINDMKNNNAIGLITKNAYYTLKKKDNVKLYLNASIYTKELELTVLHTLILDELLGIDKEKLAAQTNVTYTRSFEEANDLVKFGNAQLAFICNEIPVKSILDIAAQGEKMPQKATYFYPKLLSGLVTRSFNN
ncbi:MAG: DUF1015 domain-containing protein [Abditibacteriota bacterium]|nr:DUF1015 domain-containing protein [Abditibacteriota bacterium]